MYFCLNTLMIGWFVSNTMCFISFQMCVFFLNMFPLHSYMLFSFQSHTSFYFQLIVSLHAAAPSMNFNFPGVKIVLSIPYKSASPWFYCSFYPFKMFLSVKMLFRLNRSQRERRNLKGNFLCVFYCLHEPFPSLVGSVGYYKACLIN